MTYENLTEKEKGKIFYDFLIPFAVHRKFRNNIKLYLGEDCIQNKEIEYSGVFLLHFYGNLFGSSKESHVGTWKSYKEHCSNTAEWTFFPEIKMKIKLF